MSLSEIRKTIVTALGLIVALGGYATDFANLLPAHWSAVIASLVGAATVILSYLAPNETTKAQRAMGRSVRVKGQRPVTT